MKTIFVVVSVLFASNAYAGMTCVNMGDDMMVCTDDDTGKTITCINVGDDIISCN